MSHNPLIFINNEQPLCLPIEVKLFIQQVVAHLGLSVEYIECTLLNPKAIQELNQDYFKVNTPTDTISFNLTPDAPITGDIYLCPDVIQKNASEYNVSFETELKLVIIHSILHLMGESDTTEAEFTAMKQKQELILNALS